MNPSLQNLLNITKKKNENINPNENPKNKKRDKYESIFESEEKKEIENSIEKLPKEIREFIKSQKKQNKDITLSEILQNLKNTSKPINTSEYIKLSKINNLPLDKEGGLYIEPKKEFVLKTKNINTNEKIFINVVSHPVIAKPAETEIIQEETNQAAFRIPMSVNFFLEISDNKNKPCKSIDVVVNPFIINKLKNEKGFIKEALTFLYELLMDYFTKRFQIFIAKNYILLKRCDYKGNYIQFQRVKAKKKLNVKVVNTEENKNTNKKLKKEMKTKINKKVEENIKNFAGATKKDKIKPEWDFYFKLNDEEIKFDGSNFENNKENIKFLIFLVKLPILRTAKYVDLIFTDNMMAIENRIYELYLKLPLNIKKENSRAEFCKKKRILKIECMCKKEEEKDKKAVEKLKEVVPIKQEIIDLESEELYDIF